ncbi:MAG: SusC/RagA family TonB-linked outer membrane protein [Bacteroidota bacterium]
MKSFRILRKIVWGVFFLLAVSSQAFAQNFTVNGKVSDEKGSPLPGTSVFVKGSATGTITDSEGLFSLTLGSATDTLIFSFVGYQTTTVPVAKRSSISVTLQPERLSLNEVVVMGYSEKRKSEITSAVSVVSEQQLNDVAASDMTSMLQGKVAGAQITASSGQPGQAAEIRIRGTSSFTGNGLPLYVVDGIPAGQGDPGIDPNMIESVTVLKDAGSTGMFGSKANSGVIVITTKRGKTEKPVFEFSSSVGYKTPEFNHFALMTSEELKDYRKDAYIRTDYTFNSRAFKMEWPDSLDTELRNFDWLNAVYRPAMLQNYNLSASGKTDKYNYFVGGSFYDENGTFVNTGFRKFSLRSNNEYRFSEKLSLTANFEINAYTQQRNDWRSVTYSVQNNPIDNPYDSEGNLVRAVNSVPAWRSHWNANGLQFINYSEYSSMHVDNRIDLGLTVKILPWLTFSSGNRVSYYSTWNLNLIDPRADCEYFGTGQNQSDTWYGAGVGSTNLFRFSKDLGEHHLSGLLGGELGYSYDMLGFGGSGTGLVEGYSSFATIAKPVSLTGYSSEQAGESLISQLNYNFRDRYFLSGSYRVDADSRFAPNRRVAAFPTLSGSWLVSRERFAESWAPVISDLKLRLSYGLTGNNNIGQNLYMAKYDLTQKYNGGVGANPSQLANPDLSWEKTSQLNFGIDLDLAGRVNLIFDIYRKHTTDLLIPLSQVLSTGYETAWTNFGEVYNRGAELYISGEVIKTQDLRWIVDFNISRNRNEVAGVGETVIEQNINGVVERNIDGQPVWSFYGPKWLGVDPETGNCLWEVVNTDDEGNVISRESTTRYVDATSQIIGNPWPDFTGGFGTDLHYRFITLHAAFAFSKGADVYNQLREEYDNDGKDRTLNQQKMLSTWSRWTEPGDNATHPFFNAQNIGSSNLYSSRYLEDGSFLKLRSLSLSFDLPTAWARNTIDRISLTLSGNNLFTWTKYSGIDPEASLANTGWSLPGVANTYVYPLSRQYLAALKINF